MTEFSKNSHRDLETGALKVDCSRYYHTLYLCEVTLKSINKRAKMALYRSPDYQKILSQLAFQFKRRSPILIFKMTAILDFQSERF